jgi:hypothetical protein
MQVAVHMSNCGKIACSRLPNFGTIRAVTSKLHDKHTGRTFDVLYSDASAIDAMSYDPILVDIGLRDTVSSLDNKILI